MGVQERRLREKQELRQEILDAARDLFVHEGYDNVSMRKIAEKIEYSPTTIYLYFKDKSDLLDQLCEETFARLEKKSLLIDRSTSDPLEALRKGLRNYIDFGVRHPNHYKLTFMTEMQTSEDPEAFGRTRAAGQRTFDHLAGQVAQCAKLGIFQIHDVRATSQILWAAIHGITSLLIVKHRFEWVERERLIEGMLDTVLSGLGAPKAVGV